MEAFLGSIYACPYNFAPQNWAFCLGQILPIASNTALFALLGTYYGGNGTNTFGLPNLGGSTPIGFGNGAGLQQYPLGEPGGTPFVTLIYNQMPSHNHTVQSIGGSGENTNPNTQCFAKDGDNKNAYSGTGRQDLGMAANMLQFSGGNQPHPNMMPYLVVTYAIALQGIFPSRN